MIAKNVQRIKNIYRQQDSLTPILLGRTTDVTAHSPRVRTDTEQQNSTDNLQKTYNFTPTPQCYTLLVFTKDFSNNTSRCQRC